MSITYYPRFTREAVYLINGSFVEKPAAIPYAENDPLYITVLPLSAVLLPYTVKLLNGEAVSNRELCDCYAIKKGQTLVVLKPRHNYVYAPEKQYSPALSSGRFEEFFTLVKKGDTVAARKKLTEDLSAGLSDDALSAFFEPYEAVCENVYDESGGYLLLGKNECSRCYVSERSGQICDISCE